MKVTWHFDGFMSSLPKVKKWTCLWIIENESVRSASKLLNLRVKMEKKWQFNEKFRSDAAHLSVQSRSYIYLIVILFFKIWNRLLASNLFQFRMLLFNFSWYRKQIKNLCILFLNVSLCFCFLILFQTLQTGSEIILGGGGSGVWKCQVDWHIRAVFTWLS